MKSISFYIEIDIVFIELDDICMTQYRIEFDWHYIEFYTLICELCLKFELNWIYK